MATAAEVASTWWRNASRCTDIGCATPLCDLAEAPTQHYVCRASSAGWAAAAQGRRATSKRAASRAQFGCDAAAAIPGRPSSAPFGAAKTSPFTSTSCANFCCACGAIHAADCGPSSTLATFPTAPVGDLQPSAGIPERGRRAPSPCRLNVCESQQR